MTYEWRGIDTWGDIGKSLGGVAGEVTKQYQQSSAYSQALAEAKASGARTDADLTSILLDKFKGVGGQKAVEKFLPAFSRSAGQFPEVGGQPAQPEQPVNRLADSLAYRGYQPETQAVPEAAPPAPISQGAVTPGAEIPVTEPVAQDALQAGAQQLIDEPATLNIENVGQLAAKYAATPVQNPNERQAQIQQLLDSNIAPNRDEASRMVDDRFNSEVLRPWESQKSGFDARMARLTDAQGYTDKAMNKVVGNTPDSTLSRMADQLTKKYAFENNPDGTPKYEPLVAADLATRDADRINKLAMETEKRGEQSWTEYLNPNTKRKRIAALRANARSAKKHGVEEYMRDIWIKNGSASPAEASAILYGANKGWAKKAEDIPLFRDPTYSTRISDADRDRLRPQVTRQAADLYKAVKPNESLVVLDALLEERGLDMLDREEAFKLALDEGFQQSPLHEREDLIRTRDVKWSFSDFWLDRPKSFKRFMLNL